MAGMALLFNNSTPQSLKDSKLYDENKELGNDDLQDVLDGLLKLGVSNNKNNNNTNNNNNIDSMHPLQQTPSSISKSLSPNGYTPKKQKKCDAFVGMNLLMAAVNKVEQKNVFKIDIADINRITNTTNFHDVKDECVWDNDTRILKRKSENAISVPPADDFVLPTWQFS